MKTCKNCNEPKGLFEFYAHPTTKDRLFLRCKECEKARAKADYRSNPSKARDRKLKNSYGLDREAFDDMIRNQENRCAICETEMSRPHVDHDHKSLKVRGLLCNHCNLGLGHFFDNTQLLAKALQYLERHGN